MHTEQPEKTPHAADPGLGMFCTKKQVAKLLNVLPATVDNYRRKFPDFPKARILMDGHAVRFKTAEVIQWIDSRVESRE